MTRVIQSENSVATPLKRSSLKTAIPQILAVCVKNILLIAFGMTLGYPTILIPGLSGSNPNETLLLTTEQISWISSINLICVPVGCSLSGVITQPLGRRRAMQVVNIPFVLAWLLFNYSNSVWQIYVALSLTGLSGGLLEAPVLTYVAEITEPHLRGTLSATSSLSVIAGIFIQFLLGTFFNWRTIALISCIFPVASFMFLFLVPESPHWLILKNRLDEARKSIAWLRGWTDVKNIEPEFLELCKTVGKHAEFGKDNPAFENGNGIALDNQPDHVEGDRESVLDGLKRYTKKTFFWPFLIVSFTFLLGHFSGMTTLQTYAVQIFTTLQAPTDKYFATVILGVAEVLGCVISVILVHYVGKRILTFVSLIGCGICFLVTATYTNLINVDQLVVQSHNATVPEPSGLNWIPMTSLIGSAFFAYLGVRILPWILIGEVYPNDIRAAASGLSGGVGYIFGFLANKTFLNMVQTFTLAGTFWFYASLNFVGTVVLYFALPETEGKTLFEITNHFAGVEKINNKVYRGKQPQKKPSNGEVNCAFESKSPLELVGHKQVEFESRL